MATMDERMGSAWGCRGIIGDIEPAVSAGPMVQWFYETAPAGVGLLAATLGIYEITDSQVERALSQVDDAAKRLAASGAHCICLGGTPLGIASLDWNRQLVKRLEEASKLPSTTTMINAVEALTVLGAKKIVIASPFEEELNKRHVKFWEECGFNVVNLKGLGLRRNIDIKTLPASVPYNLAMEAYRETAGADAIYMPCASFGPPVAVECLERDLGIPVVTSTQALIWAGLKTLKIKEGAKGYGRLFECL